MTPTEELNFLAAFALLQVMWKDEGFACSVPTKVVENFLVFLDATVVPADLMSRWVQTGLIHQAAMGRWRITGKGLTTLIEQGARLPIDENGVELWSRAYTIST
ncbi:TPA: hypothetical protein DEP34_05255 [Candidatus Uhrbacteria bacterium]|uniref:Uncharacterized protein n=2 Tax=Candidatus Uhriibacteriota TaxID=1752732 RepID=A0A0G1Q5Z4_9BACT|nr:MAG: hypothetical protein UX45_C0017G0014 [Candidatus Uhrbacteria bacterium GW2011_GWF2_46_218]KKU40481.1 MAG: hypothetical protein UX57_C0016G0014 [Candidatus Uhrbacteria bacterium GW2011_GWE2_46_68]HBK34005.1 hypothetical protein [Candidatus Uhrbacteria bacterium]HCB19746.1 hypothetical protein [Candidatus Uhrbacteria bacterium]